MKPNDRLTAEERLEIIRVFCLWLTEQGKPIEAYNLYMIENVCKLPDEQAAHVARRIMKKMEG